MNRSSGLLLQRRYRRVSGWLGTGEKSKRLDLSPHTKQSTKKNQNKNNSTVNTRRPPLFQLNCNSRLPSASSERRPVTRWRRRRLQHAPLLRPARRRVCARVPSPSCSTQTQRAGVQLSPRRLPHRSLLRLVAAASMEGTQCAATRESPACARCVTACDSSHSTPRDRT